MNTFFFRWSWMESCASAEGAGLGHVPPWIYINDTDKVEVCLMMVFFGFLFFPLAPFPWKFFCRRPWVESRINLQLTGKISLKFDFFQVQFKVAFGINSCILKANLSWSRTLKKFCKVYLAKLIHESLKSNILLEHSSSTFFKFSSSLFSKLRDEARRRGSDAGLSRRR